MSETIVKATGKPQDIQINEENLLLLINTVRKGISWGLFESLAQKCPFNLHEWSALLHVSERTLQRIKKEDRTFDILQSERILQIVILFQKGENVFGDSSKFISWLEAENIALGNIKPINLLDSSYGIRLITDELLRIEYGILA